MKLLLLALPLVLVACVKPECVVYVNGKPVYNQCYQHDSKDGGSSYSPPAVDDNSDDSNGDESNDHSDDSNYENSDEE
jgi:hypothetical protein